MCEKSVIFTTDLWEVSLRCIIFVPILLTLEIQTSMNKMKLCKKRHSFQKIVDIFFTLMIGGWLIIGCEDEEVAPEFIMSEGTDVTLGATAGSRTTIHFESTRDWNLTANGKTDEWLFYSPTSGRAGAFNLTLIARTENDSTDLRTGVLSLTSKGLTQHITVTQEPADFVLPDDTHYTIPAEGAIQEVIFRTNVPAEDLQVFTKSQWLSSASHEEENTRYNIATTRLKVDEYSIRIKAEKNPSLVSRTGYIYFCKKLEGSDDAVEELSKVTITQAGTTGENENSHARDKEARIMQRATMGSGIPIVLMGDGFTADDVASGTYDEVMVKAMEHLFTEEPMASLRSYFNVYAVTAISYDNYFGEGSNTVFGCELEGNGTTGISGDDWTVMDYAECVKDIKQNNLLDNTLAVVVLNTQEYAGTTFFGYGHEDGTLVEFAIAYCPVVYGLEHEYFRRVIVHEAVGHGFAKLEDEYCYEDNARISNEEIGIIEGIQEIGWAMNVDFVADSTKVLWNEFLHDTRYDSLYVTDPYFTYRRLGVFEGACTYMKGAYRPTRESMMNGNILGFNAPSRRAIYNTVMRLGMNYTPTYEEFVEFDLRTQAVSPTRLATEETRSASPHFSRPQRGRMCFK